MDSLLTESVEAIMFFVHPDIDTPINIQKKKDGTAKAYQVKQAINIINGE